MGQLKKYFIIHIFFEFNQSVIMLEAVLVIAGLKLAWIPEVLYLVMSADLSVSPDIHFKMREKAFQLFIINVMS